MDRGACVIRFHEWAKMAPQALEPSAIQSIPGAMHVCC